MMQYDKVRISSINVDDGKYNEKKKKYVKYKKPKVTKKLLLEKDFYDLGELYTAIKFHTDTEPYNKIEVSFTAYQEY